MSSNFFWVTVSIIKCHTCVVISLQGKTPRRSSPKVLRPLEKHIQRRRKTSTATLASPCLICSHTTASPLFKSTAKEYQFGWHTKGCTKRVQSHVCVKMPLGNPRNTLPSLAFFPPVIIYTTWWNWWIVLTCHVSQGFWGIGFYIHPSFNSSGFFVWNVRATVNQVETSFSLMWFTFILFYSDLLIFMEPHFTCKKLPNINSSTLEHHSKLPMIGFRTNQLSIWPPKRPTVHFREHLTTKSNTHITCTIRNHPSSNPSSYFQLPRVPMSQITTGTAVLRFFPAKPKGAPKRCDV